MTVQTHPVGCPPPPPMPVSDYPSARLDRALAVALGLILLLFHLGLVEYWMGVYQSRLAENDMYETLWTLGGAAGLAVMVLAFSFRCLIQWRRGATRENVTRAVMTAGLLGLFVGGCWMRQWTYEDGAVEWCRRNVDAEAIRQWAATVPASALIDTGSAPPAVQRIGCPYVYVDKANDQTVFTQRGMGHWSLVIGPTDVPPPEADSTDIERVRAIEPGMYLMWTR